MASASGQEKPLILNSIMLCTTSPSAFVSPGQCRRNLELIIAERGIKITSRTLGYGHQSGGELRVACSIIMQHAVLWTTLITPAAGGALRCVPSSVAACDRTTARVTCAHDIVYTHVLGSGGVCWVVSGECGPEQLQAPIHFDS